MRKLGITSALGLVLLSACAGGDSQIVDPGDGSEPFEFVAPSLELVGPGEIALGDNMQIIGKDFLDARYGSTTLFLTGTYTDEMGRVHAYNGELPLEVENQSVAKYSLQDLIFLPSRDQIGTFEGEAMVVSRLELTGDAEPVVTELASDPRSVSLRVMPSVRLVQLRSVSAEGCALVTESTISGQNLGFAVEALGFGEASPASPIRFKIAFPAPLITATFVKDEAVDLWPIPEVDPAMSATPDEGTVTIEASVSEGQQLSLDPTWRRDTVKVNPTQLVGNERLEEVVLQRFATGSLTEGQANANIFVEAIAADGRTTTRNLSYGVREEWEIQRYDGTVYMMERLAPDKVSGCFPGGDVGRDLTYTEGSSITQSHSLSFRWDQNVANSMGVNGGLGGLLPYQLSANAQTTFSETFGFDVNKTVSSESHVGLNLTARIIPGFFGTCYRQMERLQREVDVVYNNACGVSGIIGQTLVSDWNFGFDIAVGESCDTSTNLDPGDNYEPTGVIVE